MKCPICARTTQEHEPHYPFCGERCRLIDLGRWASGAYRISTPLTREGEQEAAEGGESPETAVSN